MEVSFQILIQHIIHSRNCTSRDLDIVVYIYKGIHTAACYRGPKKKKHLKTIIGLVIYIMALIINEILCKAGIKNNRVDVCIN